MSVPSAARYLAYHAAGRRVFDVVPAVVAAASAVPSWIHFAGSPDAAVLSVASLSALPLLARRAWPLPVFCFTLAASVGIGLWTGFPAINGVALLVSLYTVAAQRPLRETLACSGAFAVVIAVYSVYREGGTFWYDAIIICVAFSAAVGLGLYTATRRAYLAELQDHAERLERERDQEIALAAATERARIAREMHDIVAHNLTVMVTLSEAAAALPDSAGRPADLMRRVSATGREALADTRGVLGILRQGAGQEAHDLRPVPGLGQIDSLIQQVRSAGMDTTLEISGQVPSLPEAIQLTVYRLVQEALTNALKHAGHGARATVRIQFLPWKLRLEIEDDGIGNAATPVGPGSGLTGMRERVRAYGGYVQAGPRAPHGWRVSAELNLGAA